MGFHDRVDYHSYIQREYDGRKSSLENEIELLKDRSNVRKQSNILHQSKLINTQIATNVLKYVYLLLLISYMVIYMKEKWIHIYTQSDWYMLMQFIIVGSLMLLLPYYLLDGIIFFYESAKLWQLDDFSLKEIM